MILKEYQQRVLSVFEAWFSALCECRAESIKRVEALKQAGLSGAPADMNYPAAAWGSLISRGVLRGVAPHADRWDARGEPIPHVCLKVPTGGGKTLLGAAAIDRMHPGNGLVMWIMPSKSIFRQTWDALALRTHPYRQMLEHACGGRVKLLKKDDPVSSLDVLNHLCVMPVMLQAAGGRNSRDFLRMFRDSGSYPSFFPEVDDWRGNGKILELHPDLDVNPSVDGRPGLVKQSLFNVLKIIRPIIVLDEAAVAYSRGRREQLRQFNPRLILELSATPQPGVSNILVNIPGTDLHREQMIKLPLNVTVMGAANWQTALTRAKKKRDELESAAVKMQSESGRYIRPIALIRAERVGSDQRDSGRIHADKVRDYLTTNLNVPSRFIRLKTAERDEIAGEDLLSPYSEVRYILTKDALREGWDCPFAYVLALLDTATAQNALTQMTGRVLRQPDAARTGIDALDESYVFCFNQDVGRTMGRVKQGLEEEGMGDVAPMIRVSKDGGEEEGAKMVSARRRPLFSRTRMLLPTILHRDGERKYRPLDYDADILGSLDWKKIAAAPLRLTLGGMDDSREIVMRVGLSDDVERASEAPVYAAGDKRLSLAFFVRLLGNVIPNPWLSADIVRRALNSLRPQAGAEGDAGLFDRRYRIAETMSRILAERVDREAEKVFAEKLQRGDIRFELVTDELGFEFRKKLDKHVARDEPPLFIEAREAKKSLYDLVLAREFNGLERDFAVHLDGHAAVHWWHRFVAKQDYALQGWRRAMVYPDFVVCMGEGKGRERRVLVAETKGLHLSGNPDTQYKEALLRRLERSAPRAVECGNIAMKTGRHERRMALRIFFKDKWQNDFDEYAAER